MATSRKRPPDHAARKRILEDLSTCLMVEAAAGTGKTTSLVGRMIALLREGICDVEHLAAVTFTRKAAAELRARFQLELEREAAQTDGPGKIRLTEALAQSNRCYVGTIHSFCAKLLRERPIEAGVDLAFRELEEAEDELLRGAAWSEYVAELFTSGDEILGELAELGLKLEQLRGGFLTFAEHADVDVWPAQETDLGDLQGPRRALNDYVKHNRVVAELDTLFDRFAGVFHAFNSLEQAVLTALDTKHDKEATYRLFGNKYDSLGNLLHQIGVAEHAEDDVNRYVILLCARQLCQEVARRFPEFWSEHRDDVRQLEERLATAAEVRRRLVDRDPVQMGPFLDWFEPRFLRRSRAVEEVQA